MADNKKYYWLKMPRDFFDKHYIKMLKKEKHEDYPDTFGILLVSFYIWLLTESIDHNGELRYSESKPYDAEMLASISDYPLHFVTLALQIFTNLELVVTDCNGTLLVTKSFKMIGSESSSTQRVRDFRARKKEPETLENTECNASVTQCNTSVTKCNIEIEKEKEIEKDIDIDNKSIDFQQIIDLYHTLCPSYPSIKTLSDARKKSIKARLKIYSIDDFVTLFQKAEQSSFLKGNNSRNWSANFDWLIKDTNMAKVIDGNYDEKVEQKPTPKPANNQFNNFPQRDIDYDAIERKIQEAQGIRL